MAENPLAIRASEEVKALFNELAEQGEFENKGEFLNRLLILYQSESAKKDVAMMKPAIETVETLTTRLLEVLNGTAAAITTKEEKHRQELDEQKKSFEETRTLLQRQITSLEQDRLHDEERIQSFIEDKDTAESKTGELLSRIKELEQAATDSRALIDEYKEKNDTLNSIVTEYKAASEESKRLQSKNAELTRKIQDHERELDALNEKINKQAAAHAEELQRQQDTLRIEREKAILELERKHQTELQAQQERHSGKIAEYETKILNLIDEKTANKPSTATPKKSPARGKTKIGAEQVEPTTE